MIYYRYSIKISAKIQYAVERMKKHEKENFDSSLDSRSVMQQYCGAGSRKCGDENGAFVGNEGIYYTYGNRATRIYEPCRNI